MPPLNETLATPEQRERAVGYWETVVRPDLAGKERATKPQESPEAALARLKAEGWGDLQISDAIRATLLDMRRAAA
jgi:hypothetical protein